MDLLVNEIIRDKTNEINYRVLWIDSNNTIGYVIDIDAKNALPRKIIVAEIIQGIITGDNSKIREDEHAKKHIYRNPSQKDIEKKDKAWEVISDIISLEPDIYSRNKRGKYIDRVIQKHGTTKVTVYKYLRKYWQRGKTKECLLPDYDNVGRNTPKENRKGGRPNSKGYRTRNIDEQTQEIFKRAYKKYYLNHKKNSLSYAYKMMIREFYAIDIYFKDGREHVILNDEEELPSINQFRYWYRNLISPDEGIKKREGFKAFERDSRALLGSSTYEVFGPGSKYQIDATPCNVYLVSRYNQEWIIGRPVLYLVIDVYSRMIVGMYVGLEGPSWIGMMMALYNTASNKQEFCGKYGITITKEDWPSQGLPETIVGDRGELEGLNINQAINGLNISIELNPAYRPDWKGIVEKLLDKSQSNLKPFLPGYVDTTYRERGMRDYRVDAALTIEKYTEIIIHFILHHNKNLYMANYTRDNEMIRDEVKPTPLNVWSWGIKNRTGKLKEVDEDILKFYLLPTHTASVTAKGIKFKKLLYNCASALKHSWFSKARQDGTWKVKISYDPRNLDQIFIHKDDPKYPFEVCSLLEHQESYKSRTYEEILQLFDNEKVNYSNSKFDILQNEVNFMETIESIVREAEQKKNESEKYAPVKSNSEKTKGIRRNRKMDKLMTRQDEYFKLSQENELSSEPPKQNESKSNVVKLNNKQPSVKDLYMKKRMKRKNEE
ncbi:Mu transposase C-terminal domain-containing protein [Halalkalibacillus sediminis]|nr:Mu transposase C-terminal domain-containing protein [Halalkalibacillus sediminis]